MLHQQGDRGEARERAIEMLRLVRIPSPEKRVDEYPHQLSGGMRQRVMIAMALSCDPELLIADEPTTALDVTIQAQILTLIRELQDEFGMSVLLITHDLGVVAQTATTSAVMYAGKVVERAATRELFKKPQHPYTVGLFRSIPKLGDEAASASTSSRASCRALPGVPDRLPLQRTAVRSRTDECVTDEPPLREIGTPTSRTRSPAITPRRSRTEEWHRAERGEAARQWGRSHERHLKRRPAALVRTGRRVILSVRGPEEVVPDQEGALQRVVGSRQGGRRRHVRPARGRDARPGGRVGLRQDDRRPHAAAPDRSGHRRRAPCSRASGPLRRCQGRELRDLRRRMQIIFQDPYSSLNPRMTVEAIVGEALDRPRRWSPTGTSAASASATCSSEGGPRPGPPPVSRYPHEFSGGQRQRIGIARAIALEPEMIVCDEPVSAPRRVDPGADHQPAPASCRRR